MEAEKAMYAGTATGLVGGVMAAESTQPLQRALNEHGEQLDKLSELVSILESRLHPVRSSMPQADGGEPANALRSGSPTFNQVVAQTDSVGSIQRRISNLLEELDV